ncbi:hypothetical protein [Streptomyces sp. NPDC085529]|uniref:hypothetical protein n=1 Tax=Streptomyces sp. NPDC085529 TaxID=3365729 RepID=UPI0037D9629C
MTDATPSRFMRLVLRMDTLATSRIGTLALVPVLIVLVATDTVVGYMAAGALFSTMVAVGVAGRRSERRNSPLPR